MSALFSSAFSPRIVFQTVLQLRNVTNFFAVCTAARFTFFIEEAAKRRYYSRECKTGRLAHGGQAKRDALLTRVLVRQIPSLVGVLAFLVSLQPLFGGPAPGTSNLSASRASTPNDYMIVSHLGETDQQAALRDGQLLSHRRATDPFGNTMRGSFKGLPPIVEHATVAPSQSNTASPVAPTVNVPTLERAVQELAIGAVSVSAHEILIGARAVHEGDLLVLESGGRQFPVWIQTVGVRGVTLCDVDLQKHIMKTFGSGQKELPEDTIWEISDMGTILNKDGQP
jgi:hypothetical protein